MHGAEGCHWGRASIWAPSASCSSWPAFSHSFLDPFRKVYPESWICYIHTSQHFAPLNSQSPRGPPNTVPINSGLWEFVWDEKSTKKPKLASELEAISRPWEESVLRNMFLELCCLKSFLLLPHSPFPARLPGDRNPKPHLVYVSLFLITILIPSPVCQDLCWMPVNAGCYHSCPTLQMKEVRPRKVKQADDEARIQTQADRFLQPPLYYLTTFYFFFFPYWCLLCTCALPQMVSCLSAVSLEYLSVKGTIRYFNWIQSSLLSNANISRPLSFNFCLNNTKKIDCSLVDKFHYQEFLLFSALRTTLHWTQNGFPFHM